MRNLAHIFVAFFLCSFITTLPILGHAGDYARVAEVETKKQIALTFDDGPNPKVLPELLALLEQHDTPATFFVIGSVAKDNSAWLKREASAGHEIESHSYGHDNFKKIFPKRGETWVIQNLAKTAAVIEEATGKKPRFFRPPFWEITDEITKIIEDEGYTTMRLAKPDVNTLDYEDVDKNRSSAALVARVKKLIENREKKGLITHVLVFHELSLTAKALKDLIPYFKIQGYEFVRLDKLRAK